MTAIALRGCSACWGWFAIFAASSSFSPLRATTSRAAAGKRKRSRGAAFETRSSSRPRFTTADRRARLLLALGRAPGVPRMEDGRGGDTNHHGNRAVPELEAREPHQRQRGLRIRQVLAQTADREEPARSTPWRGWHHPGLDLARPAPDRGRRLRLPAVLRGQRGGCGRPGDADGSATTVIVLTLFAIRRWTTPTGILGRLNRCQERSLRILNSARAVVNEQPASVRLPRRPVSS